MEVTGGAEEGFIREWTPCSHILGLIPPRIHSGIFSTELSLTCVDTITEYIALGTNVGLVYWYDRKKGNIQKLKCETSNSPITYVKIVNTVDYMVGAGNEAGQVSVFQIPKEHPENIPENLKPKVEPKVERYTIGDLHRSAITSIEWSKNGMRLFSGDKNGVIIMTEIDFYMHLCKSMEIVNEQHEIVQMSYCQSALLVSSMYRSIVCERVDGKWVVAQIGKKDRKSLCSLGGVFQYSYGVESRGGAPVAYCARAGLRLWRADRKGNVQHTLLFKEAVANPLTVAELLNPSRHPTAPVSEPTFGPLHVYREHFLVSHDSRALYVLDPRSLTAVAVVDDLRRILSVSVNKEEIFILEGPRSLIRLAHAPEIAAAQQDEPLKLMTKSLTTTIQHAVNTMRDLTHIDQTVPFIASVLEQPISMFTKTDSAENGIVGDAEECFELPPIKQLPNDISGNVLESIVNEFKDVSSEVEEIRRAKSEELQKKLKLYNSIMEKKYDEELIHCSRRSKRREGSSGTPTPRVLTPVRKPMENVSYTSPCVMNMSIYSDSPQNDDLLEKQIEEKEIILAKMLNLESLSIKTPKVEVEEVISEKDHSTPTYLHIIDRPATVYNNQIQKPILNNKLIVNDKPLVNDKPIISEMNTADLVPKIVKLPNTWNLEDIELELDIKDNSGNYSRHLSSSDDHLDSEWEII